MTFSLDLTPESEQRLGAQAAERHLNPDQLLQEMVAQLLTPPALKARVPGLHRGQIEMAEDFDAPLPGKFWQGIL